MVLFFFLLESLIIYAAIPEFSVSKANKCDAHDALRVGYVTWSCRVVYTISKLKTCWFSQTVSLTSVCHKTHSELLQLLRMRFRLHGCSVPARLTGIFSSGMRIEGVCKWRFTNWSCTFLDDRGKQLNGLFGSSGRNKCEAGYQLETTAFCTSPIVLV